MVSEKLSKVSLGIATQENHNCFKQTEIGEIPKNWKVVQLDEVAASQRSSFTNGPFGSNLLKSELRSNGVPVIYIKDIKDGFYEPKEIVYVDESKADELSACEVLPGDVLITKVGDPPAIASIYPDEADRAIVTQDVIRLRVDQDKCSPEFIRAVINSPLGRRLVKDISIEGTRKRVALGTFKKILVPLPPLPEQKSIAEILSSVDEASASTQAVIDQTRKVKQGLLQQLLTRGEHSDKKDVVGTKKAPLRLLDEVAKRVTGHTPNRKKPEYWDGGIKWVSLQDSAALDRVYIHETAAEISEEGIRNSSAVKHPKGVLSRDAGVGKSAITTDEMAVSQHFIGWICNSELDNYYLYYWLQYMKPFFEEIAIGNTIKTIGMPFFKSLKIPVPPIETQIQIASILLSTDKQFFFAEEELERLNILKRGLMQDLLTGRVRVYSQE